jgi:TonB family protein
LAKAPIRPATADGTVGETRVTKPFDSRFGLDAEAVKAASGWLFKPGMLNGQAVPVRVALIMTFRLGQGSSQGATEFGRGAYPSSTFGLVLPKLLRQVAPKYTSDAMKQNIQGEAVVEAVVKADGSVGDVRVVTSLDSRLGLDAEALKAARQWTFEPATLAGQPVPVIVTLNLTFRLKQRHAPPGQAGRANDRVRASQW